MIYLSKKLLVILLASAFSLGVNAQQVKKWQEMHKVKKSETIFGIAKKYGITVSDLINANPDMNISGYELKKGDYIFIPYPSSKKNSNAIQGSAKSNTINVAVALPLHNVDGDGLRMIEYYRGMLMACDEMRAEGINIHLTAVNTPIEGNIYATLAHKGVDKSDIIFGPLYTKQVKPLANFAMDHGAKLVIPFSIMANDVNTNPNVFQVYQSPEQTNASVISQFIYRFNNYHIVFIDCNDKNSDKGIFTFELRKQLEGKKIGYNITNLTSSLTMFSKAFSTTKPNMVILNTGRSPELTHTINKLDQLQNQNNTIAISLFGYTEWLMYVNYNQNNAKFCKYDAYIPTLSYYNSYSSKVRTFENQYRLWFKSEIMDYLPRFALMGYDHAMFFVKGIIKDGKNFTGADADKNKLQTPLHFRKIKNGGYQNCSLSFVHFNRNNTISTIDF